MNNIPARLLKPTVYEWCIKVGKVIQPEVAA